MFLKMMREVPQTKHGTRIWTCSTQHPIFLCDYAYEHEAGRRTDVRGALPLVAIEKQTEMDENYYDAETNGTVRLGKFLKMRKN